MADRPATKQDREAAWTETDRLLALLPESLALSAREMAKELRKACEEREAELARALVEITPPMPGPDAQCHVGIVPQERCAHCGRVARAHAAAKGARHG